MVGYEDFCAFEARCSVAGFVRLFVLYPSIRPQSNQMRKFVAFFCLPVIAAGRSNRLNMSCKLAIC